MKPIIATNYYQLHCYEYLGTLDLLFLAKSSDWRANQYSKVEFVRYRVLKGSASELFLGLFHFADVLGKLFDADPFS